MTADRAAAGAGDLAARLPSSAAGRLAVGYVAGVGLARAAGLALPLAVGPFAVTLSAVALPVLFWTGAKLVVRPGAADLRTRLALALAAGVVGDELVYLGTRAEGVGYWSATSLAGSAAVGALALGVGVALARRGDERTAVPAGRWLVALSTLSVAASYVGFRVTQVTLRGRGVPNEGRSLVLAGFEVHHATTGSLLLVVAAAALASRGLGRRSRAAAALAFAVGAGFVADQYPYLFYPAMTDALYFGRASLVGGALATGTVMMLFAYNMLTRREAQTGGNGTDGRD